MLVPGAWASSDTFGIRLGGRLSITKNPRSSRMSAAWERPAPDSPVITTKSLTCSSVSGRRERLVPGSARYWLRSYAPDPDLWRRTDRMAEHHARGLVLRGAAVAIPVVATLVLAGWSLDRQFGYDESVTVGAFVKAPTFREAVTRQVVA